MDTGAGLGYAQRHNCTALAKMLGRAATAPANKAILLPSHLSVERRKVSKYQRKPRAVT